GLPLAARPGLVLLGAGADPGRGAHTCALASAPRAGPAGVAGRARRRHLRPAPGLGTGSRAPGAAAGAAVTAAYDAGFLGPEVVVPVPQVAIADDLVVVDGSTRVDYAHYSLAMSRARRLARWVAWNID